MQNMETSMLSIITPIIFCILLALLFKKVSAPKVIHAIKLPPSPWKLPFIGSLHHLPREKPHRKLLSLANKYGPILHLKLGQIDHIVITSSELAQEVLMTHDINFASRPQFLVSKVVFYKGSDISFSPYGKYWLQLRKICTSELLNTKRVESFSVMRDEEGHNLVEKIRAANGLPVNLTKLLLTIANTLTSRAVLGKDWAQQEKFIYAMKKVLQCLSLSNIVDIYPSMSFLGELTGYRARLESVHQQMDKILDEIIEDHQATKHDRDDINEDIVDVFLRIKKEGRLDLPLSRDNIKAALLNLLVGGTETTASTIVWAMSELIRHPSIMQKAQSEVRRSFDGKERIEIGDVRKLPYFSHIIKETLRLHPAGTLLARLCQDTIKIGGYTIPSGSRIIINIWAIMRDPKYWEDSEKFLPERFADDALDYKGTKPEYIPFGAGRRICPGQLFSTAAIECWLALLLFHFDWKLPKGKKHEELDMDEVIGSGIVSRKNDLILLATPH